MKAHGKCATCKKTNLEVRLYRPYGNFYRPKDNLCNEHVPEESRGWYVPLTFDDDGSVWGYTSVPQHLVEAFNLIPEANPEAPTWFNGPVPPGVSHWQDPKTGEDVT
jgi:hypothetical protein